MTIIPPSDWQPVPTTYRLPWYEQFKNGNGYFIAEVEVLRENGEVEIEYRIKNSRYPDPGNRYWWRRRQPTLFD